MKLITETSCERPQSSPLFFEQGHRIKRANAPIRLRDVTRCREGENFRE